MTARRGLTLEQVREAGRFAKGTSNRFRFEYLPSGDWCVWDEAYDFRVMGGVTIHMNEAKIVDSRWPGHGELFPGGIDSLHPPLDGWHHLPGCDCEFCR